MSKYILFLNDWKAFPGAIVDETTTNESWLFMSDVYAAMGVNNHFFHLALINPRLKGVSPFDPDLTLPWKSAIAVEATYNPWYYFREVARAPQAGNLSGVPLQANRGNIAVIWCFLNHVSYFLMQIRQTGKSLIDDSIDNWILHVAGRNININKLTKDAKLRATNIARLKELRDMLPSYINPFDKRKDKNNSEELSCVAYENTYSCFVGQTSIAAANNVGRGTTAPIFRGDEIPFSANSQYAIPAAVTAGTEARRAAEINNTFWCNSFTTTAGKLNTEEGKFSYKLLKGAMPFDELLFDSDTEKHLHRRIKHHSPDKDLMVGIVLNHKQMGKSDEWLYEAIKTNKVSGEEADRDFFNRWTAGGLTSPFDRELSERIARSVKDRLDVSISDEEYIIKWFVDEHELKHIKNTRKIIIGNDTSMAVGKDALTLVFLDSWTGHVLGTSTINEANLWTYIHFVTRLVCEERCYVIIPERRANGQVLIDGLIVNLVSKGINPLEVIYNTLVDSENWMSEEMAVYRSSPAWWSTQHLDKVKRSCGYATSGAGHHARSNLYGRALTRAAKLGCDHIYDATLADELNSLVIRNDRIDHAVGSHDDTVIAWLLAYWMLMFSKNLGVYGITNPLCEAKEWRKGKVERELSPKEQYEDNMRKVLRQEFNEYLELLKQTDCHYTSIAIENRLRRLYVRLGTDMESANSIDDLIRKAKERSNVTFEDAVDRREAA